MSVARAKATASGTLGFTVDWSVFLPAAPLPDTGPRTFVAGEVWAIHFGDRPAVVGILSADDGNGARYRVLSGWEGGEGWLYPSQLASRHAQRIDAPVAKMWADGLRGA